MIRQQYDGIWQDAERMRAFVDEWAQLAPELFPEDFDQGYCLHGFGRESRKLPGLKLRKIVLADGTPYWLRPSFVTSYMTGTVDQLAYPLLLAAHGVPPWLLTIGFGHSDMYWYRVIERLGRNSLVGSERSRVGKLHVVYRPMSAFPGFFSECGASGLYSVNTLYSRYSIPMVTHPDTLICTVQ